MHRFSPRTLVAAALLLMLALVPVYAQWQGEPFLLALFGRVLVYGVAALALNLLLGYGGMVSFGHALYLGLGAYSVGVMSHYGIENGWLHLAGALGACAVVGLASGYVAMRTSGIAFIMIDRRTLITRHIAHAGLQQPFRDGKNPLAAEFFAFADAQLLDFFFERPFSHLELLRGPACRS